MNIYNILCFEMDIFCWFHLGVGGVGGGVVWESLLLSLNLKRREILLLIKVENN